MLIRNDGQQQPSSTFQMTVTPTSLPSVSTSSASAEESVPAIGGSISLPLTTKAYIANSKTLFRYAPLDHSGPSIRLVRISPVSSPDGLTQCTLSHATTDARYVCLSYVWDYHVSSECELGDKNRSGAMILLNGRAFLVRENLFHFLCMARKKFARKTNQPPDESEAEIPFWVDALCIDQSNPEERNHQVAQMGGIYSNALSVQIWLGKIPTGHVHAIGTDTVTYRSLLADTLEEWKVEALASRNQGRGAVTRWKQHELLLVDLIYRNPY
ncbi:HET-domain-containing protein [Didymella exigua CBS 183.55]|uniref:HET-domain-containing protein n=1 Tax=Didymella exigua CBS 183.55 TaxID=1150837 RepID=A0A6A5RHE5_9PLEO|nr:HET-domain-containing protein [Didymella exigua CBS 183.55]KAF1926548.1 HET-domain-containing protein [Didymella exigua CBS 183.55]